MFPPARIVFLEENDASPGKPYYRRHLLQFGGVNLSVAAADLTKEDTMQVLAWVIRYFVAHVAEDSKRFWTSMVNGVPVVTYMTPSDLSFALLVLEHHIMKWRHLIQVRLETGEPVSPEYCRGARGLLYDGGIAGEEAKRRFDDLHVYFYSNFYSRANPHRERNVILLQKLVDTMAKRDSETIKFVELAPDCRETPTMEEISEDILHRVFYYMFA